VNSTLCRAVAIFAALWLASGRGIAGEPKTTMEMKDVRLRYYDPHTKRLQSEIACDWAGQVSRQLTLAKGLTVRLLGENSEATIVAPLGRIYANPSVVALNGGVRMTSTGGKPFSLSASYLLWYFDLRRIVTNAPVTMVTRDLKLTGRGLRARFRRGAEGRNQLHKVILMRNVAMVAGGELARRDLAFALPVADDARGELWVTCDGRAEMNTATDTVTFNDHVVVRRGRMRAAVNTMRYIAPSTAIKPLAPRISEQQNAR